MYIIIFNHQRVGSFLIFRSRKNCVDSYLLRIIMQSAFDAHTVRSTYSGNGMVQGSGKRCARGGVPVAAHNTGVEFVVTYVLLFSKNTRIQHPHIHTTHHTCVSTYINIYGPSIHTPQCTSGMRCGPQGRLQTFWPRMYIIRACACAWRYAALVGKQTPADQTPFP